MWPRLTFRDVRIIGHYLGVLVAFSSLTYLVPVIMALFLQEWEPASRYLLAGGLSLIIGMALQFLRVQPGRLSRQQALVVTGLAWILLAWVASFPLYYSGHFATYLDALFDGVSGLTTTGASTIVDLDHLSYADNMFRFIQHLLGGLGLIVVALSLGLFGRGGAGSLYNSEARSEHVVPNVVQTARFISRVALLFIVLSALILSVFCLLAGMEPLRAFLHGLWLAVTGFITGGFSPTSQSVVYYHSLPMEIFLMLLMLVGSINFVLHDEIWKGRLQVFFRDIETRTMLIWLACVTLIMAAAMCTNVSYSSLPIMLRRGLFMIVSAFSTTGLQNVPSSELATMFTSGSFLVLAMIMAVGGSAGGTAGGLKLLRVGIVAKSMLATIKETLAPDSARVVVTYYHVGRRTLSHDVSREALTVFLLYVITYAIGSLFGVAYGNDASTAIFESVAMTSNGGLSAGIVTAGMPWQLELVYIFQMWAGRLEFVTLLALIVEVVVSIKPRDWKFKHARNA